MRTAHIAGRATIVSPSWPMRKTRMRRGEDKSSKARRYRLVRSTNRVRLVYGLHDAVEVVARIPHIIRRQAAALGRLAGNRQNQSAGRGRIPGPLCLFQASSACFRAIPELSASAPELLPLPARSYINHFSPKLNADVSRIHCTNVTIPLSPHPPSIFTASGRKRLPLRSQLWSILTRPWIRPRRADGSCLTMSTTRSSWA